MKKLALTLSALLLSPLQALAESAGAPDKLNKLGTPIKDPDGIIAFIANVNDWIFASLLAIAVFFILIAAWEYVTSKGGEGVEKAHKMILYAAVAIVVGVLAKGIVAVIATLAGQGTINQ
jgi:hypothetical protein